MLDQSQQRALLSAAEARVAAARATLENLETGSRSEELDVIRASLSKAEADLGLARKRTNLTRSEQLEKAGTVSAAKVEVDSNAVASAEAPSNN
ncbi:hypothetical protein LJR016_004172 [Devosia sp. LjRoot16]|uniref:hypothetical protein n=1 Tax=Devosia sp. LjRoot16 TaxID=3342271 RepID=UPI003ECEBD44